MTPKALLVKTMGNLSKHILIFVFLGIITSTYAQNNIIWNSGSDISTNTFSNNYPRMTLDGSGNPLVVWGRSSDQSVFFSRWTGTMFTQPVKLNPSWLTVASASWMGPDIASKGDTVYVVVKRTPENTNTNRLFIFTSFNGGVSFNTPVEFAFIADSLSRFPTVTIDESGNPIVAFMKFNASFGDSRWVVLKSTDYGNTFNVDIKVSGWGSSAEVCDCCPGAVTSSGNTCAMMYRDNNNDIRDSWAGISVDNASSFTSGFVLENSNWNINYCTSSGPDGVIIGDTLYAVFMNGASGSLRAYLSKSSVISGALSSVSNLTEPITGLSQQNYPRIATDGKAMAIVWKQIVSGGVQLPILFTNNLADSFPASYDTVALNNITNTDVAISNGNIYVVWQDDNSGTVKFRSGAYPISTGIHESTSSNTVSIFPNPFSNSTTLQFSGNLNNATLTIFNVFGKIVKQTMNISGQTFNLTRDNLPSGLYAIQLTEGGNVITNRKLVITD